ncbi:hypothetical protein Barb4_01657 [Bacteroidales bacterium Barb4]|nr:hypothetical protein Barb4_01657 [Bacteroidales bacterium Barb4]
MTSSRGSERTTEFVSFFQNFLDDVVFITRRAPTFRYAACGAEILYPFRIPW